MLLKAEYARLLPGDNTRKALFGIGETDTNYSHHLLQRGYNHWHAMESAPRKYSAPLTIFAQRKIGLNPDNYRNSEYYSPVARGGER